MKALTLLQTNKSVQDRANQYVESIKKDFDYKVIRKLEKDVEALEAKIFDLSDFSLDTNLNKGMVRMNQEECQKRFEQLFDAEYELTLLKLELTAKKDIFNKYFGETATDENK